MLSTEHRCSTWLAISLLLLGLAATATGEEPSSESANPLFRVVTYNIRHGAGADGRVDLDRIAGVLRKLEPDFVALQEVDENTARGGKVDQSALLGEKLGMHHAFGSFMPFDGGRYGMAVLSRHPIRESKSVELPRGNEPRVALAAEVSLPSGESLTLVNVHFDWVDNDSYRFKQAEVTRKHLDGLKTPYLLLGDFNDQPESRTLGLLRRGAVEAAKPDSQRFTWPAAGPSMEIDFIIAGPAARWKFRETQVIEETVASDHRPVFATLELLGKP